MCDATYYKFFSLRDKKNFKRVLECLSKDRLYMPDFKKVQSIDKKEANYRADRIDEETKKVVSQYKKNLRICCCSNSLNNDYLWGKYQCCISFEIDDSERPKIDESALQPNPVEVSYGDLIKLTEKEYNACKSEEEKTALIKKIFSSKLPKFEKEQETRFFKIWKKSETKCFLKIKIREFHILDSALNEDKEIFEKLICRLNNFEGDKIEFKIYQRQS